MADVFIKDSITATTLYWTKGLKLNRSPLYGFYYSPLWRNNDTTKWTTEYSWLIKRPMSNVHPCRNLYLRNLTMGITCNLFAVSRGARISNQRYIDFVFDTNTPIGNPKVVSPVKSCFLCAFLFFNAIKKKLLCRIPFIWHSPLLMSNRNKNVLLLHLAPSAIQWPP